MAVRRRSPPKPPSDREVKERAEHFAQGAELREIDERVKPTICEGFDPVQRRMLSEGRISEEDYRALRSIAYCGWYRADQWRKKYEKLRPPVAPTPPTGKGET